MVHLESSKPEYTEAEAASALGISVDELRALVRRHVIKDESDRDIPIPNLRPSDLLVLKMLFKQEALFAPRV